MKEKVKVPELRFDGFTDDWEEHKLGEYVNFLNGRAYKQSELLDKGKYKVVRVGNFNTNDRWYYSDLELDQNKYAQKGDLLYLWATNFGPEIWSEEKVIYHYHIWKLELLNNNLDKQYLYTWLVTDKERIKQNTNGTTMVHVTKGNMEQRDFQFPGLNEQQKIGSFFKQLDETIALHQRKLDLLKEQKKGYLQKMFPKNGEKVPELRFAGFADDWEERKLKDVTERVRSNDGRMDLPTLTMSASSGWLDQKDRFSGDISGKEKKNYTLLKKGELSYNHGNSKLAKYGVVFSLTNYEEALVPRVYHSFKALENTSADFIEYMFSTKLPDRELGKLISSGARMDGLLNINYDDFMNIHISIPNYEEQILMSAFFRKLDENIALHQRKLDLLKEQKKGFLQKMFV